MESVGWRWWRHGWRVAYLERHDGSGGARVHAGTHFPVVHDEKQGRISEGVLAFWGQACM